MSKKFSTLAAVALASFAHVAQVERDLEVARDDAEKASDEVVAALKTAPRGKVALVEPGGDVAVYTLTSDDFGYEAYKVETIAGDFDVAGPVEPEPTPESEPEPEPTPETELPEAYEADFSVS